MACQAVKKKKLMSEYDDQLYEKVHNNIVAAKQGNIAIAKIWALNQNYCHV